MREEQVTKPLDFKNKEESYAGLNANGTGPYMLVSRAPGIKTVYKRNPNWWGKPRATCGDRLHADRHDATRPAALVSGEIDFVLDPAPRDVARLRNTAGVKIIDGPENRIVSSAWTSSATSCPTAACRATEPVQGPACAARCTRRSTSRR